METFLIKLLQLVCALALLMVIHELGHYLWARIFGIRVEKFYLFFNPYFTIWKWKPRAKANPRLKADGTPKASWRDTEYGLGWLPLGAYVKIAGMIDESMDKEQMAQPAQPWEFRSHPAWQRLFVMVGGVMFNFILAFVIYAGIAFWWGEQVVPFDKATEGMDFAEQFHQIGLQDGDVLLAVNGKPADATSSTIRWDMAQDGARITVLRKHQDTVNITVPRGFINTLIDPEQAKDGGFMTYRYPAIVANVAAEPAISAGLQQGDRVVSVGTDSTPAFSDVTRALTANAGVPTTVGVLRGDSLVTLHVTPTAEGKLGFQAQHWSTIYPTEFRHYGLLSSVPRGAKIGADQIGMYVSSLGLVFTKEGAKSIGGFGAIGSMFPDQWNWLIFWNMTAFLSLMLGVMNLLPIPALDGGHVMFTLWEIVTRRRPNDKFLERAQMAGMAFLLVLLVYANANDVIRWLGR